jgi:hypothetical protein
MTWRSEMLARRRELLVARGAAQRLHFERQLQVWRGPLRAFDMARYAGARLRKQASLVAALAGLLVAVTRGRIFVKAARGLRLVRFAVRWWTIGQMFWRLAQSLGARTAPR